jgi:gliding motility-associated-like protein
MNSAGLYSVACIIKDSHYCKNQITTQFTAETAPTAEFTTQPLSISQNAQTFTLLPKDSATFYYWTLNLPSGTIHSSNPLPHFTISEPGCFPVNLQVIKGNCRANTLHDICINDMFHVYIPDVFTPNHDAVNDYFNPTGNLPFKYKLQIFDRWGILQFESLEYNEGWDGTSKGIPLEEGTYLYKIQISTPEQTLINKVGSVLLMR